MHWMSVFYALVAVFAGALVAIQPGINGLLAKRLEHPIQASLISFSCGLTVLVAVCFGLGQRLPRPAMLEAAPVWVWVGGGTVGAFFVTTALIVAPRIGAAYWVALIVAGQMFASLLLDEFGWLGFARRSVGWEGWLGAVLVVAGVALVSLRRA
ncbi:MAG: DMT family transporter [Planctomycetota bacterium]|jgi:transporter family-2 protein